MSSPSPPDPELPDIETLKSQLAEAQQLLQDYQNKVSALQAQLQQVTAHRDELQRALAQLQAVAEERAKTIQELQSRRGQVAPLPKPQPQPSPLPVQKKIMNRPIFDNVSPTDEDMPPYMLD